MRLERLQERWRREMRFLGLIKPNTDIGDIKLIETPCRCGCPRKAMLTEAQAKKKPFLSALCKEFARDNRKRTKEERLEAWRQQMNYFVKG